MNTTQNFSSTPSAPTALVKYPQLSSISDSTNFRIKKIMDDEKLLQDEIKARKALCKKYGRIMTVTDGVEFSLIAADIILGFAAAAIPGVGVLVSSAAFSGVAIISGISKLIHIKLTGKKMKHYRLSTIAQTTLANITFKISKAISDGQISHEEFEDIQNVITEWKKGPTSPNSNKNTITPDTIELLSQQAAQKAQEDLLEQIKKINGKKIP
jgi:hypothetical protein